MVLISLTEHHVVASSTPWTPAALAEVGLRGLVDLWAAAGPTALPAAASAELQQPREEPATLREQHWVRMH